MSRFRQRHRDELDEEIRHHIRERAELLVQQGWEPEAARREAERRFGDRRRIRRELARLRRSEERATPFALLRSLLADARYASRGLREHPTFALAVVATLALGIGAASSIFAVVDALLLRPLPYRDPDRWVETNRALRGGGYTPGAPIDRIAGWQQATTEWLDAWVAFTPDTLVRTDGPQAEALRVVAVTPGADTLLGIPLLLGRGFTAGEARPGAPAVVVLSRRLWERMGADPGILGTTLRLEDTPVTVVGVLTGGVKFPDQGERPDLWLPLREDFTYANRGPVGGVYGLWARLTPGLGLERAQERADVVSEALERQHPGEDSWSLRLVPLGAHRANPDVKRALATLGATVGAIFLVALVNGVNLLLVRSGSRAREIAVRKAVGASSLRLFRQFAVEGMVLGSLGGAAAAGLAGLAVAAMRGILPFELTYFSPHAFAVEWRTLAFTFAATLVAGTVLGLLPGLQALRRDPSRRLAGRSGEDTGAAKRMRGALVVAQLALSTTLLVAAALLVNSFARLVSVDPGYDVGRVAIARLVLSRYEDTGARADFVARLRERLLARPEVESVALSSGTSFTSGAPLVPEGEPAPAEQPFLVPWSAVEPGYLATKGIVVRRGRGFEPADIGTRNVVVDEDLARLLWGERSAVDRAFRLGDGEPWTVIGVVDDLTLMGRDQRRGSCQFLVPLDGTKPPQYLDVILRTPRNPEALLPVFERTLRQLDPEQWIWRLQTAAQALAEDEQKPRFMVTLMGLLAGIAVTLAAVGLYGVLAYSVARRNRELGIRIALGADRRRLRAMVLGQGVLVASAGVALGLLGAVFATRLIESLLYDVPPRDVPTFAATAALLLAVAAAASALPARRATHVDPVEVLRSE